MRSNLFNGIVTSFFLFLFVPVLNAQSVGSDVYWHIDPSVKTCSMVIDPTLTQPQWHKFVTQVGAIASFKSMTSANTLGKMNFKIAIDYASTPVDQHDLAWINTFTHPDESCPLGDAIVIPTIRASMGITNNIDIGAFWTTAPRANYGMVGGEFKYAFLQESEKLPAAAIRGSFTILTGVADYDLSFYSIEVMASKKIAFLTPYLGVRQNLGIGVETTTKVNLNKESILFTQGYAGVSYSIWMFNLVGEYNVSYVNTFALGIGFNF